MSFVRKSVSCLVDSSTSPEETELKTTDSILLNTESLEGIKSTRTYNKRVLQSKLEPKTSVFPLLSPRGDKKRELEETNEE